MLHNFIGYFPEVTYFLNIDKVPKSIEFFQIEKDEDGKLFFYGYEFINQSGSVVAGALGGAIGGAIHAAAVEADAMKHKVKYMIDPNTGEPVHPVYGIGPESAFSDRDIMIYRPHKKETETDVQFLLDEKFVYSFAPGSYINKPYGPLQKEAKICVGANFEHCITVSLPHESTSWIRLSFPEVGSEPKLEQVENVDMFEYNKAANKQDKRERQEPVEVLD